MKRVMFAFLVFLLLPLSARATTITLFYGDGCPHCAKEELYLDTLQKEDPTLKIVRYETWYQEENATLMSQVKETFGVTHSYVPFTVIGTETITGFSEATKSQILSAIQKCKQGTCPDIVAQVKETGGPIALETPSVEDSETESELTLPILGQVDTKAVSIPLIAIVLGFVDGFNPCAMWILLFLIGMLLGTKDRRRMWILGLTFLITSGVVYLLFMMAWLQVALKMNQIIWIRNGIALLALVGAFMNLYSFWKPDPTGCHVVEETKRKTLMKQIKRFVTEQKFFLAIVGIMGLAIVVNFVELACSAGLPLLFTQILALNNLSGASYIGAMLLYILFYMIDDIAIFAIAMVTFKLTGISNKYSKYSHLIGGILMLVIGILLLLHPSWLMFG